MAVNSWTIIPVVWPLPVEKGKSIRHTVEKLSELIREQYGDQEITFDNIFVGKPELDELMVYVGHEYKMLIFSKANHVKPDSMEIRFLKPIKTE